MAFRRPLTLAALALIGAGLWRNARQLIALALRLPPVRNAVAERGTQYLLMPDGTRLATDIFLPRGDSPAPTILIRTPYGRPGSRSGLYASFVAQRFAERGYNVVYQDVRGRFGSEGDWEPYVHEAEDGAATVVWIVNQPWSDGQIGMWGQSYVGYTLWATATSGSPHIRAIVPVITQSHLAERGAQGYQLDRTLRWLLLLDAMVDPELPVLQRIGRAMNARIQDRVIAPGFTHLPLETVDEAILGKPVPFYRKWVEAGDPAHPYWEPVDFRGRVAEIAAPAHLVGGWYDIFLEGQINDYMAQRGAGRNPFLTVGPWTHLNFEGQWESVRLALDWFDWHLRGATERARDKAVRLYVMGAGEWREYDTFPPPSEAQTLYLREGGQLAESEPAVAEPGDEYHYDPADPTPNIGGALLSTEAGPRDNRPLEARLDVLVYTGPVLDEPFEIIGAVHAMLWVASSVAFTDFFVRLTDLFPDGRSINICDGHIRLSGFTPYEPAPVTIECAPTAYRFQAGHRIRLQVSSGAHPRIARNLGSGEAETSATALVTADQIVYHDSARASHIVLPKCT